jgi:SHR-binding domain of vacuolar-sorting associated protein 13
MRSILVRAHSNDFFYSSNYKASIKVEGYDWSKVFDGTTMGLSGFVEVKSLDPDDRKRDKYLNFGVLFENGVGHYSRTKIIKIVPRYIIFNSLDDDIVIR